MDRPVYVSLTSIPSRVSRILDANLQSLLTQDHPVERIVVTIPTVNYRGQPCDTVDASFLNRQTWLRQPEKNSALLPL